MQRVIPLLPVQCRTERTVSYEALAYATSLGAFVESLLDRMRVDLMAELRRAHGVNFTTPPMECFFHEGWANDMRQEDRYRMTLQPNGDAAEVWGDLWQTGQLITVWEQATPPGPILYINRFVRGPASYLPDEELPHYTAREVETLELKLMGINDHTGRRVYAHVQ